MKRPLALGVFLALVALMPLSANAGDIVFGLGHSDFASDLADEGVVLDLELHSNPIWNFAGADWSLAAVVTAHSEGDFFVGAGAAALWPLRNRWFVEGSIMPGFFEPAGLPNDLGSDFEIRTLLGIGRQVNDRLAISLAASHKSNAGASRRNPGVNVLSLRTRWSF